MATNLSDLEILVGGGFLWMFQSDCCAVLVGAKRLPNPTEGLYIPDTETVRRAAAEFLTSCGLLRHAGKRRYALTQSGCTALEELLRKAPNNPAFH